MIKWLGIHYKFPPVATVSSRRLFLLYQALDELTEDQVVVTSAEAAKRPKEAAFSHNFRLAQVGGRGLREWLYGAKYNVVPNTHKQRPGYEALVRLRETSPFDYWMGEGGPAYRKQSLKVASKLIEQEGITHLFSSFRPWVDHQIAAQLKQRYPKLYWIADFRDLPMDPLRSPPYGLYRHKKLLKKRLSRVDELWTVSEGLAEQFRSYHKKVRVVYGGLADLPAPSSWQSDQFVINYGGSVYPELQDVHPLLSSLERLSEQGKIDPSRILIRYAGRDRNTFEHKLADTQLPLQHEIHEMVSLQQAKIFQQHTHINLLLSWSTANTKGILTAKLFDYLAAGRPILALINGPDDPELRAILENSNSGFVHCRAGSRVSMSRRQASIHRESTAQSVASDQENEKPGTITENDDIGALDHWILSLYRQWYLNNGQLVWNPNPKALEHLQPLPILRRLLI